MIKDALTLILSFPNARFLLRIRRSNFRCFLHRAFYIPYFGLWHREVIASSASKTHSRPQWPRSFWSAPRIATSCLVQRHSVFEWLCKHNRLRPEPIRFAKLDSEHAQSDGKSVNRGLPQSRSQSLRSP